jgi:hypothetical protein
MPRGDKSKYTNKQERKADHIAESYESRGVRRRRPRAAPGPRPTRKAAAARRVGPAAAIPKAMPPRARAGGSVVRQLLPDPLPHAQPRRRRQLPPASAMRLLTHIIDPDRRADNRLATANTTFS